MKKICSLLSIILIAASCKQAGNEVVYIHSDVNLDTDTQALLNKIKSVENKPLFYLDETILKSFWDEAKEWSYESYCGALPEYRFSTDTSSIFSDKGYRTLLVGKDAPVNIMFVHGGAWTYQILDSHLSFIEEFVCRANARAYVPLYPMLPNWTYEPTFEMLSEVYDILLQQDKPIIFIGDSAGGNLILGFTAYLQSQGKKLPDMLLPISPAVDLTGSTPEMAKYKDRDPMLDYHILSILGPAWAADAALDSPIISPINADLKSFPPTFLFVGTEEILYPAVNKFAEKLAENGVPTSLLIGEGLWHVAPVSKIPVRDLYIKSVLEFYASLY